MNRVKSYLIYLNSAINNFFQISMNALYCHARMVLLAQICRWITAVHVSWVSREGTAASVSKDRCFMKNHSFVSGSIRFSKVNCSIFVFNQFLLVSSGSHSIVLWGSLMIVLKSLSWGFLLIVCLFPSFRSCLGSLYVQVCRSRLIRICVNRFLSVITF